MRRSGSSADDNHRHDSSKPKNVRRFNGMFERIRCKSQCDHFFFLIGQTDHFQFKIGRHPSRDFAVPQVPPVGLRECIWMVKRGHKSHRGDLMSTFSSSEIIGIFCLFFSNDKRARNDFFHENNQRIGTKFSTHRPALLSQTSG